MLLSKVIILLLVLVWGCTACLVLEAPASIVSPNLYHLSPCFFRRSFLFFPQAFTRGQQNSFLLDPQSSGQSSSISSSPWHWCFLPLSSPVLSCLKFTWLLWRSLCNLSSIWCFLWSKACFFCLSWNLYFLCWFRISHLVRLPFFLDILSLVSVNV